jgi:hypothetical protein
MKNKFLLLAATLILSTTTTFATAQVQNGTGSGITAPTSRQDDMLVQVKVYMEDQGIVVVYVTEELGSTNYLVKDGFGKWYRVYVCNQAIIGWGEIDM